jgi:hypothetical protein
MRMFRPLIAMAALLGYTAPTARESRSAGAVITADSKVRGAFGASKYKNETTGGGGKPRLIRIGTQRIVTGYRFRTNSVRHVY